LHLLLLVIQVNNVLVTVIQVVDLNGDGRLSQREVLEVLRAQVRYRERG
jgi:hypothetical protein